MYTKAIDDIMIKAAASGYVTAADTDALKRAAAESGENADEVMQILMMRLAGGDRTREAALTALERKLAESLDLQHKNPGMLVGTFVESPILPATYMDYLGNMFLFMESCQYTERKRDIDGQTGLQMKIGNCELDLFDGSSPLPGTLGGEPRLQLRIPVWGHEKFYDRFRSLPVAELFTEVVHKTTDGDVLHQYFIDCGSDTLLTASVYTTVLDKVYGVDVTRLADEYALESTCFNAQGHDGQDITTKAGLQAELEKYGLRRLNNAEVNSKMLIRKDAVEETVRLAREYNERPGESAGNMLLVDPHERLRARVALDYDSTKRRSNHGPTGFFSMIKRISSVMTNNSPELEIERINSIKWAE